MQSAGPNGVSNEEVPKIMLETLQTNYPSHHTIHTIVGLHVHVVPSQEMILPKPVLHT